MTQTPLNWRRAWQLHRSVAKTDSRGDPIRTYDMTHPDYVGQDGETSGVCWQIGSDDSSVEHYGEQQMATAFFVLYGDLVIAEFDRCVFGGRLWEVAAVTPWLNHRRVELKEVSAWM